MKTFNFSYSFSLLLNHNPVMKDQQGICVFDKQIIEGKGDLRLVKIENMMVVILNIGGSNDTVIFDITDTIGLDTFFSFEVETNKVTKIFIRPQGKNISKIKFARSPS